MGANSKIEWCDHTFNPVLGCVEVSAGCAHCYAKTMAKRNPAVLGEWGKATPRRTVSEAKWREPLAWDRKAAKDGVRRRVFCGSMCDVFEDHPDWVEPRARLLGVIAATPHLDWLLLTKRPENVARLWPERLIVPQVSTRRTVASLPNMFQPRDFRTIWIGTSVENQETAESRIPALLEIDAAVRFVSCEPLLGPVDLGLIPSLMIPGGTLFPSGETVEERPYPWASRWIRLKSEVHSDALVTAATGRPAMVAPAGVYLAQSNKYGALSVQTPDGLLGVMPDEFDVLVGIDWVICGGESGPGARPMHPDWARSLLDQCEAAGVPFFFKQWGEWGIIRRDHVLTDDEIVAVTQFREFFVACSTDRREVGKARMYAMTAGTRDYEVLSKIGKQRAGRLLDGREWSDFPTPEVPA